MPVIQSSSDLITFERAMEMRAISSLREVYQHPSWTLRDIAVSTTASGPGAMVAVGDNGSIVYGPQGRAPSAQTAAGSYTGVFNGVCTNNTGTWVAVGQNQQIQTSTNGTSWTSQRGTSGAAFDAVSFGNGVFTAIGGGGLMATCPNSNGAGWTNRSSAFGGANLAAVFYVQQFGRWFVTDRDGRVQSTTDPQGTWTSMGYTVPGTSPTFLMKQMEYSPQYGLLALYRRNTTEIGFSSYDGGSWTTWPSGTVPIGWAAPGEIKFTLMDRSIVLWDWHVSPSAGMAYVVKSPDLSGDKKFLMLGTSLIQCARNVNGQLFACGQINSGPGTVQTSSMFRPNTFSE